jgi:ferredoxin
MRVSIDADRCRGYGLCGTIAPELFAMTDDGYSVVTTPEVPAELEEAVREAVHVCPERAITAA